MNMFQTIKPLQDITRLAISLVAVVLLTNVSQAATTKLSDTFARVNSTVVEIRTLSSSSLPPNHARALNVPQTSGMLIQQIAEDSPAQAMGLRESDILIEIDGRPVMVGGDIILAANGIRLVSPETVLQARDAIRALPGGERLTIEILRRGQRETIEFIPVKASQDSERERTPIWRG